MDGQTDTSIEDSVYERAARLLAVRDAVAEEFGGHKLAVTDPNDLREIARRFRQAITAVPGAYGVIIGGLAVQELGYARWTEDVDAVVDAAHYGEILALLRDEGFVLKADFTLVLRETGVKLVLLREGITLKNSRFPLPHPSEFGANRGFATFAAVVRLKLDSGGRLKDLADVVELLKRRPAETDSVRAALPDALRSQFDELVAQARREQGGE